MQTEEIDITPKEPGLNSKLPLKGDKPTKTLNERQQAYQILREQGMNPRAASISVGYDSNYGYTLEHKLKKFRIKGNEKLLRKASRALNKLVEGKTFGELKEIKDSTVMSAVREVYERHEPVIKQSLNLNINADISPVDLSKYRCPTD